MHVAHRLRLLGWLATSLVFLCPCVGCANSVVAAGGPEQENDSLGKVWINECPDAEMCRVRGMCGWNGQHCYIRDHQDCKQAYVCTSPHTNSCAKLDDFNCAPGSEEDCIVCDAKRCAPIGSPPKTMDDGLGCAPTRDEHCWQHCLFNGGCKALAIPAEFWTPGNPRSRCGTTTSSDCRRAERCAGARFCVLNLVYGAWGTCSFSDSFDLREACKYSYPCQARSEGCATCWLGDDMIRCGESDDKTCVAPP